MQRKQGMQEGQTEDEEDGATSENENHEGEDKQNLRKRKNGCVR